MAGTPEMQEHFPARACMAEVSKNEIPLLWPWMASTPEMQEHFPAGAQIARYPGTKEMSAGDMPEMQEQFPAGA